jgi:hypothetical protein
MSKIDIIIPTMWAPASALDAITHYCQSTIINKIIIIDNNRAARPKDPIFNQDKIEIVDYGRNIYVNPAWNEGVARATSDLVCILNDDIFVSNEIFEMIAQQNFDAIDLIGVNLRGAHDNYTITDHEDNTDRLVRLNYDINRPIGGQAWAFGICMFMQRKKYSIIPSLYQVWYGDDYIAQRSTNIYALNTNKIKGKISATLTKHSSPNSDISKRVELDSKNFIRFGHFRNGNSWDIAQNTIKRLESERKMESIFPNEYHLAKTTPSDINENVHILYELATQCDSVVEMGVRTGVSTRAFLNTDVKLTSYDIALDNKVGQLFGIAKHLGKNVNYIQANVLDIEIEECDLLFIDTLHTYKQLSTELKLHGNKAKRYIAFHDTHTFGLRDEVSNENNGLLPAIIEFMIINPHWRFKIYKTNNNGLTVLERQ